MDHRPEREEWLELPGVRELFTDNLSLVSKFLMDFTDEEEGRDTNEGMAAFARFQALEAVTAMAAVRLRKGEREAPTAEYLYDLASQLISLIEEAFATPGMEPGEGIEVEGLTGEVDVFVDEHDNLVLDDVGDRIFLTPEGARRLGYYLRARYQ